MEKVIADKDNERIALLEEQKKMYVAKLAEEDVKVKEAQSLAKKASVASAMAVAAAELQKQ